MTSREEFKKYAAEAITKANEAETRLGITVEHFITDWEEKLKGNDVSYPMSSVPHNELKERLFKIHRMAIENYAASIGATVSVKYFD